MIHRYKIKSLSEDELAVLMHLLNEGVDKEYDEEFLTWLRPSFVHELLKAGESKIKPESKEVIDSIRKKLIS